MFLALGYLVYVLPATMTRQDLQLILSKVLDRIFKPRGGISALETAMVSFRLVGYSRLA